MIKYKDIYEYATIQENAMTSPITIVDNWEWSFREHVRLSTLYKNSRFDTGHNDDKPFKNIVRPILNLQYRAEGFDVKDIELFIDDSKKYFKSFLIKKFHEKWAREENMDTFIDEMVESYVDYGAALIKKIDGVRPELVNMQTIAFCDQTNLLSGPFAIKHFFSPNELKDMAKRGWKNIDEVITLAEDTKRENKYANKSTKTPGKYIEVYEIHGILPQSFLDDSDSEDFIPQIQVITFYDKTDGQKQGITLFRSREPKSPFKLILRDAIYGRALGFGGIEELFEPQVWINYDQIRIKGLLDAAAKVILQTSDPAYSSKNKIQDMENLEITVTQPNTIVSQIPTAAPANLALFERSISSWENLAERMGGATEALLGENPPSGTPFKLAERVIVEGKGLHEYRKGKLARFLDEIYRDWIIPHIAREVTKDQEFLTELDLDELQTVADSIVEYETNKMAKEKIFKGQLIFPEEIQAFKVQIRNEFLRDNKKFIKILEDELKDAPVSIRTNIAGKQKDLGAITDKMVNIFRQIIATPQVLDDPRMAKLFNMILESSGLSPITFGVVKPTAPVEPAKTTEPIKQLTEGIKERELTPV